jgi:hypothetical protein
MPTLTQVLNVARSQLGQGEWPRSSNRTPYGAWFGMDAVPWCDIFVCWVFGQLPGGLDLVGGKFAATTMHAQWFQRHGRWGRTPRPGAVVFFDFPGDSIRGIQHVGLVEQPETTGGCRPSRATPGAARGAARTTATGCTGACAGRASWSGTDTPATRPRAR